MLTWIRSHLGGVAVTALALVVVGTSSATATLLITGQQIKDNTITSLDLKDGTVTTKDMKKGTLKLDDMSKAIRDALAAKQPPATAPSFVGSACTVPGVGTGTISLQVAANGSVTIICAVPSAVGQNGDLDNDGYVRSQECNDTKAAVHPGATEVNGNRFDDDCDGVADDGTSTNDDDGDGFTIAGGDCDDTDATTHQGAVDTFGNGIDNDCDGVDG